MTQSNEAPPSTAHGDHLRILELTARFADAANRHDWEAIISLCDERVVWETSAGALGFRHEGRSAVRRFLLENPHGVEVVFYMSAVPVIELLGADRARTRLHMTEILKIVASGETKRLFGTYSDELVKREGRWLFAHRRFTLQGSFDEPRSNR